MLPLPLSGSAVTLLGLALIAPGCAEPTDECPSHMADCGDVCADLSSDPENCGGCGESCAGQQVCAGGQCALPCSSFNEVPCEGGCTDTSSDRANCGACGNVCPGGFTCFADECRP